MHKMSQFFCYRKAETCSTVLTSSRLICLSKFIEQMTQCFRFNADAGIDDFQLKIRCLIAIAIAIATACAAYAQFDITLVSKLYSVTKQVKLHLPKSGRISGKVTLTIGLIIKNDR